MKRLLVTEEAFVARGRGVLLAPRFTAEEQPRGTFDVVLRFPDGSERTVRAELEVSHVRGPLPPWAMIRLPDLAPDDVPPGTEVWTAD